MTPERLKEIEALGSRRNYGLGDLLLQELVAEVRRLQALIHGKSAGPAGGGE